MFFNTSADRLKTNEPQSSYHQNLTTVGGKSAEMHQGAHVTVSMDDVWEFWISFQKLLPEQHF